MSGLTPQDGRDDLELPGAAVRAMLHVDVEDALEQPCPTHAVRPDLHSPDLALGSDNAFGGRLFVRARSLRHDQRPQLGVRGQDAMEPDEVQPRTRYQRRCRCMNSSGDITRCVVPSRHGVCGFAFSAKSSPNSCRCCSEPMQYSSKSCAPASTRLMARTGILVAAKLSRCSCRSRAWA